MKYFLFGLLSLLTVQLQALEFEVQLDNEQVTVVRVKVMPNEEIGLHRDEYPQVVYALQGGVITRLEADGSTTDVEFPTGQAVYREIDPPGEQHSAINNCSHPVEIISVRIKQS